MDYQESLKELNNAFLKRGYQQNHLTEQFNKASTKERSQLLRYKEKDTENNKLLFITTYNKTLPTIQSAINKQWNLLKINDNLAEIFKEQPKTVYRQNKNLRDLIGQTTLKTTKFVGKRHFNKENADHA